MEFLLIEFNIERRIKPWGDLPLDHNFLVQLLFRHRSDQQEAHLTVLYQVKRQDDL